MPSVKAGPNEFLLIARKGALENRGSAVTSFLWPGTVWVVVPAAKQEAAFEFTQETRDGIPLRFKGIIIFRVTDPLAAAGLFDFAEGAGVARISEMLTHVVLGELRHAVSHMTMVECIEERKTTLSGVADASLRATVAPTEAAPDGWGITIEVAQLAQVFIVDTQLRQQLEAEVRNEIRLKSEQSELRTREESRLSSMASDERIEERKLGEDRERLRRQEELELVEIARRRRMKVEEVATERQHLALDQERVEARLAAEQARLAAETPVKLLRLAREAEVLQAQLAVRELRNRVRALEVVHELAGDRARQALRAELLPLEQAPQIVEAASGVFRGASLSIYGENAPLVGQLAPVFELLGGALERAAQASSREAAAPEEAVAPEG